MASRLRAPAGSKVARPVHTGSGLKTSPTGLPANKPPVPVARAYDVPQARSAPQVNQRRLPVQGRPVGPTRPSPVPQSRSDDPPQGSAGPSGTASLEVGDKVLCAGGKAGVVAFIGATQFAKGMWAGVVLDSKEGKNNGSVNGVQYFECQPNQGLFARPEKLVLVAKASELRVAQVKPPEQPVPPQELSVGDEVLADGGKQGVVAFYGNTQFARGVWVGVVLEVPEGKNNGAVAGVQYFECEPNHGLFTRPQKLTLLMKGGGDLNGFQREQQALRVPPLQRSTQSTPVDREGLRALHEKLKVGDQVLVGGAKEGILRYIGPTEFAKGVWVGVELHEALGKNDGAVSGKRYFQCQPRYGLFAPLPKVEKLASAADEGSPLTPPVSQAPPSLPVSQAPPSPPPTKHQPRHTRALSGSSASSLGSSKLSRDVASVASLQGTAAEEFSQLLQEKEQALTALQGALGERERERDSLKEQVTELSRRLEDLQFQLEEQGVISGDQLETATEDSSKRLLELERADQEAGERTRALQGELLEKERQLTTQLSTITELRAELSSLDNSKKDILEQVDELSRQLALREEDETQVARLSGDSSQQLAFLTQQLGEKEKLVGQLHSQLAARSEETSEARDELEIGQEHFLKECERLKSGHKNEMSAAEQDLNQLRLELQQTLEALESERRQSRTQAQDRDLWWSERSRLQADQERLLAERDRALGECDHLRAESASASTEQNELARQRRELMAERDQLIAELQALQTEHEKVFGDKEELLGSLQELQAQRQEVLGQSQQMSLQFDSTQSELLQAREEVETLKVEMSVVQEGWEHERVELQEQLELARVSGRELEQRIEDSSSERDSTLQQAQEISDRLDSAERERDQLQLALENAQNQIDELQFQLDELSQRHRVLEREANEESVAVQQRLEATESLLGERERELAEAKERVGGLEEELVISERSHDMALVEEEKQLLEERVKELTLQLEAQQGKRASQLMSPGDLHQSLDGEVLSDRLQEAQSQLLEEQVTQDNLRLTIEENEQQIDFLNSVIADLQRKLETAEALAGLHGPLDGSYPEDEDLEQGLPPPRLFCDICDEFDQHDTDDCPLQAASDTPPLPAPHVRRVPGGSSDRPYCENCEVFGHSTDECEYDVTY